MPNTAHAYEHVEGIYLPIAVGVFVLVLGTLLALLIAGARRKTPGRRSQALVLETAYACVLAGVVAFLLGDVHRGDADRSHGRSSWGSDQGDRRAVELALHLLGRREHRRCRHVASDAGVCADGQRG